MTARSGAVTAIAVGDITVTLLNDGHGVLGSYAELYPNVPRAGWEAYRSIYPELFAGDDWRPPFGSFAIETTDATLLIDTGVGPPPGDFLPEREGLLLEALDATGIRPVDVDVVFLTHLHLDHIGWNVDRSGNPTFPNAGYVTHEVGWRWAIEGHGRDDERTRLLAPLQEHRVLELITGPRELVAGVDLIETPGHLPGHMSVVISSGGDNAVILGDVAVHPAQLEHFDWQYLWDDDPQLAIHTRRDALSRISKDTRLLCGHFPGGRPRLHGR